MGSVRVRAANKRLYIDFRHQGIRCREQTLLEDTPANRKKLQKLLARIDAWRISLKHGLAKWQLSGVVPIRRALG